MRFKAVLLATGASLLILGNAYGTQVFSDDFDGYNIGDLVPAGTGGNVGQGGWTQLGTSGTNPIQVNAANEVGPLTTGQDVQKAYSSVVTNTAGHSMVCDFDLSATTGDPDAGGDFFMSFNPSIGSTAYAGRIYAMAGVDPNTFQLSMTGLSISATDRVFGAELNFSQVYHVTATWHFVAGDMNDTFDIAVDGAPYVTGAPWVSTSSEPTTFGVVTLRQGGANSSNVTLDNIVVSDVVPEPASLSLLALGGLGLLRRRRRA